MRKTAFFCNGGINMDYIDLIRNLSNAKGVSGFEDEAVAVIRKNAPSDVNMSEDRIRNLYMERKDNGDKPLVVLDAHTDEVGFIVQRINSNGTMSFLTLGGIVASNIPAHKVKVLNSEGKWISGIVAAKPPHFMSAEEKNRMPRVDEMVIDVGASSREEAEEKYGMRIAAPVVFDVDFEMAEDGMTMIGKAFDDRIGCAAQLAVMRELEGKDLNVSLTAVFSSQEEVGARGAAAAAPRLCPSIAICFEGCPADDTVVSPDQSQTALGKGPMLRHIDVCMITNPRFQRFALDIAEKYGIPVQEAVRAGGGTNAASYQKAGAAAIVIGIPVRYAHSHYGFCRRDDFENAVRLGAALMTELDKEIIDSF